MPKRLVSVCLLLCLLVAPVFAQGAQEPVKEDGPVTLKIWTFDQFFKQFYEERKPAFQELYPNIDYVVEQLDYDALYEKLNTVMLAGGQEAPDIIDMESGQFGSYTRGDVPFEPLTARMKAEGKLNAISPSRSALYTIDGEICALEHQLVPTGIAYRWDWFEQAGIDVDAIETWSDFEEAGKILKAKTGKYILGFNNTAGGVNGQVGIITRAANREVVSAQNTPDVDNPVFIGVNKMIRDWVKVDGIAAEFENWQDFWASPGDTVGGVVVADWTANHLKNNAAPDQAGKWKIMPMPKYDENSSRLSVWGGTGLAMLKYSENKDAAWDLMSFLMINTDSVLYEFENFGATPPTLDALRDPAISKPDPYFSGQNVIAFYAEYMDRLAAQRPTWWTSHYSRAYGDHFYDFWEGTISATEFAKLVQQDTETFIAEDY